MVTGKRRLRERAKISWQASLDKPENMDREALGIYVGDPS